MRIKSGWWGDHRNAYSAGKLKASILKATFISKATEWVNKHSVDNLTEEEVPTKIDGPGLFVFKVGRWDCPAFLSHSVWLSVSPSVFFLLVFLLSLPLSVIFETP